jgi:hypothetical protein
MGGYSNPFTDEMWRGLAALGEARRFRLGEEDRQRRRQVEDAEFISRTATTAKPVDKYGMVEERLTPQAADARLQMIAPELAYQRPMDTDRTAVYRTSDGRTIAREMMTPDDLFARERRNAALLLADKEVAEIRLRKATEDIKTKAELVKREKELELVQKGWVSTEIDGKKVLISPEVFQREAASKRQAKPKPRFGVETDPQGNVSGTMVEVGEDGNPVLRVTPKVKGIGKPMRQATTASQGLLLQVAEADKNKAWKGALSAYKMDLASLKDPALAEEKLAATLENIQSTFEKKILEITGEPVEPFDVRGALEQQKSGQAATPAQASPAPKQTAAKPAASAGKVVSYSELATVANRVYGGDMEKAKAAAKAEGYEVR